MVSDLIRGRYWKQQYEQLLMRHEETYHQLTDQLHAHPPAPDYLAQLEVLAQSYAAHQQAIDAMLDSEGDGTLEEVQKKQWRLMQAYQELLAAGWSPR